MTRESVTQLTYGFLREYITREGYSPIYREIATGIGYSIETVRKAIEELEEDGFLTIEPRKWRGIRLLEKQMTATVSRPVDTAMIASMPLYQLDTTERVLLFVQTYIATHGQSPTRGEIATALRLGRMTVRRHLGRLRARGCVEIRWRGLRGIRVIKPLAVTK